MLGDDILPELPTEYLYDSWCEIGTFDYSQSPPDEAPLNIDGTLNPSWYAPYGVDDDNKPIRVPCHASTMYQSTTGMVSMHPTEYTEVRVFTPRPPEEEIERMKCQRGWLITVFDEEDSEKGIAYECKARVAIYTQHAEYRCYHQTW